MQSLRLLKGIGMFLWPSLALAIGIGAFWGDPLMLKVVGPLGVVTAVAGYLWLFVSLPLFRRNRKRRNRATADVIHDETELNKCRAQGVSTGVISGGVAFAILALTEFNRITPAGAPFWVILPVGVMYAGAIGIASAIGGWIGRDVGSHVIYPTRMGNHRRATFALVALAAIGFMFALAGWVCIEVALSLLTPESPETGSAHP